MGKVPGKIQNIVIVLCLAAGIGLCVFGTYRFLFETMIDRLRSMAPPQGRPSELENRTMQLAWAGVAVIGLAIAFIANRYRKR